MSSDSSSDPSPPVKKSMNRLGIGTLSLLQIIAAIVIVLSLNYLASQYNLRKDLSRGEDYSLSNSTKGLLKSPLIQQRKNPIKLLISVRRSEPFRNQIRKFAEEFQSLSNGKIKVEMLDPVRSVDRAIQLSQFYQFGESELLKRQDAVLIDAREQTDVPVKNTLEIKNNIRVITVESMMIKDTDAGRKQRHVTAFQCEEAMALGVLSACEGKARRMYFFNDKSDFNTELNNGAWATLNETLRLQNISIVPTQIVSLTNSGIPQDASGIVIASPSSDFTDEEIKVISDYWHRPNSSILVLLRPDQTPAKLRAFLRDNGITPRRDQIVTVKNRRMVSRVDAVFTSGFNATQDFWEKSTSFDGATCSLEVRERAEDLSARNINPVSLIQALPTYWGEIDRGNDAPVRDMDKDNLPPLSIAAAVIRGAANDDRLASDSSRMIVISNINFLEPSSLRDENLNFLSSTANWLVGRDDMTGKGARKLVTYKLPILQSQAAFINRLNLVFIPAGILLIALWVWNARRA